MEKRKIKAEIIAGSLNEHGQRITTWVLTYPRMIHAEMMTHRVFSRNAASSRAIPAGVMIELVDKDPFIPVAWQKEHKGMQGTEYFTDADTRQTSHRSSVPEEKVTDLLINDWLLDKDGAIAQARNLVELGCTKQLTNRLLEPFQWYTAIFTTTETENFFNLRCPQYESWNYTDGGGQECTTYKSRKDWISNCGYPENTFLVPNDKQEDKFNCLEGTDLDWLKINKGQGEIHISLLAEAMWDSMNEYDYKQLKAGEWHIPFGDRFDEERIIDLYDPEVTGVKPKLQYKEAILEAKIKIATARCARVSYNNFEGKDDYEADIKLYDILKASGHYSPFEHCSRAMTKNEFALNVRGELDLCHNVRTQDGDLMDAYEGYDEKDETQGWSGNFRGFVQLRSEIC